MQHTQYSVAAVASEYTVAAAYTEAPRSNNRVTGSSNCEAFRDLFVFVAGPDIQNPGAVMPLRVMTFADWDVAGGLPNARYARVPTHELDLRRTG